MKPLVPRPQARQDRCSGVRHCRHIASDQVATKPVDAMQEALLQIQRQPGTGSPALGQARAVAGLRAWLVDGFSPVSWYVEREILVDVARLVGQRQDALATGLDPN